MKIGFANHLNYLSLNDQTELLNKFGCEKLFTADNFKTAKENFYIMDMLLNKSDEVVFCDFNVVPVSTLQLINKLSDWAEKGVIFHSIERNITNKPEILNFIFSLVKHYKYFRKTKSMIGIEKIKNDPAIMGRSKGINDETKQVIDKVVKMYKLDYPPPVIIEELNISKSSYYRYIKQKNLKTRPYKKSS